MQSRTKKLIPARVWRILAVGAIAVGYPALHAQSGVSSQSDVFRAGAREFYATYSIFTAPELVVQDITVPGVGTYDGKMEIEDTDLWGLGFGWGINDRINLNGEIKFGTAEYRMEWGPWEILGTGDLFTSRLNLDINILKTPLTPYVTGGIGYNWFDSGVPKDDPEIICWWDPWWGYICDGYVDTHSSNEFTWNAGVGLRWDVTDGFFLKALYDVTWMEVGAAGTEAFPEFSVQVGWKW